MNLLRSGTVLAASLRDETLSRNHFPSRARSGAVQLKAASSEALPSSSGRNHSSSVRSSVAFVLELPLDGCIFREEGRNSQQKGLVVYLRIEAVSTLLSSFGTPRPSLFSSGISCLIPFLASIHAQI
jgi:hypothetical protein